MKYRPLIIKILLIGSLIGLGLSVYSFVREAVVTTGSSFCDINATFNCDVVNRGPYGKIGTVPVALLGVIAYLFFTAGSALKLRDPHDRTLSLFLLLGTGGGFLFSLYLSSVEAFILHTWCIICLSSQFTIAVMFILSIWLYLGERADSKLEKIEDIAGEAAQALKDLS